MIFLARIIARTGMQSSYLPTSLVDLECSVSIRYFKFWIQILFHIHHDPTGILLVRRNLPGPYAEPPEHFRETSCHDPLIVGQLLSWRKARDADPVVDDRMVALIRREIPKMTGCVVAEAQQAPGQDDPVRRYADWVHPARVFQLRVVRFLSAAETSTPNRYLASKVRCVLGLPQIPF